MEGQDAIKITVLVAGRPYPLRVKAGDEAAIRKIVKEVNDKINSFQLSYTDRDKQDGLAMAVLTYAFDLFKARQNGDQASQLPDLDEKFAEIDDLLNRLLA